MEIRKLCSFPRPDFAREPFELLTGQWGFELDVRCRGLSEAWYKRGDFTSAINVPFCVESEASGIGLQNPPTVVWYSRRFNTSIEPDGGRVHLCFGAVDYRADVWLNGRYVGYHEGGYTPFRFDVTDLLAEENLLVLRVEDGRDPTLPRGKQTLAKKPFLVFYPGVTGIWQPVWLERTGSPHIREFRVFASTDGSLDIRVRVSGEAGESGLSVLVTSPLGDKKTAETKVSKADRDVLVSLPLSMPEPLLWSCDEPNLYSMELELRSRHTMDRVVSYFGIREIRRERGGIFLNGEPLYMRLVLCQGYFPGGHYTPIDPLQFKKDVELVKTLGFNGVRMHQKIEDPRFLFWCDLLGCLVWEEMPSAYLFSKRMKRALEAQWREAVTRDFNHPSIIVLVPLNESWGVGAFPLPLNVRKETREYVKSLCNFTKGLDPTRLVVDNSGYEHSSLTDILDVHHYLSTLERCGKFYRELENPESMVYSPLRALKGAVPGLSAQNPLLPGERYFGQPIVVSEYGGFGYYAAKGGSALENFKSYTEMIKRQKHIKGYCYTQLYDTYQEKNGLLEFDRTPKFSIEEIRESNLA